MMSASCLVQVRINHETSNNVDVLLDSGLKLSDIIVNMCSEFMFSGISKNIGSLVSQICFIIC